MINKAAIVGMGQIGSSLGAALRKTGAVGQVIAVARRASSRTRARKLGAADASTADLRKIRDADLVVLATPVRHILSILPETVRLMKPGALLTDVGSTKQEILDRAVPLARKAGIRFIGGHPMSGNERPGLDGFDPDLFLNHPYVLIPAPRTPAAVRNKMEKLIRAIGARPLWMSSPGKHDRIIAAVIHLPHLIAYALIEGLPRTDTLPFGNSFQDVTRVAKSPVDMVHDFLLSNIGELGNAVGDFRKAIDRLTRIIEKEDSRRLKQFMKRARKRRLSLDSKKP